MYSEINDCGGYSENAQRLNFNNKKKSMTVTVMTVDLQVFRVMLLERRTCVFITIETKLCSYKDKQSFTSQERR